MKTMKYLLSLVAAPFLCIGVIHADEEFSCTFKNSFPKIMGYNRELDIYKNFFPTAKTSTGPIVITGNYFGGVRDVVDTNIEKGIDRPDFRTNPVNDPCGHLDFISGKTKELSYTLTKSSTSVPMQEEQWDLALTYIGSGARFPGVIEVVEGSCIFFKLHKAEVGKLECEVKK
jgi:hypothetical protein